MGINQQIFTMSESVYTTLGISQIQLIMCGGLQKGIHRGGNLGRCRPKTPGDEPRSAR
jgi:hypothetical protein